MRRIGRIGNFLLRFVVILVGLVAAVLLGVNAVNGARDVLRTTNTQRQHDQQLASYPGTATQIGIANATLSYERTHQPTNTPSPTDAPEGSNPSDMAPTDSSIDNPTDIPQSSGKLLIPTETATAHVLATNTRRPSLTAPAATLTLAATASLVSTPTLAVTSKPPTVALMAGPTVQRAQPTAIPSPAPRVKANGSDIINVILTGSDGDVDPSEPSYRTDSMIIVSVNRTTNTVAMLSLPRDLFVYIPSLGMQRLNTAFQWGESVKWQPGGGFGLLQQTVLYNFGIPIHYYARISFNSFKQIIDTINGIDLAVDCPVSDLRYQGPVDNHTPEPSEYTPFTLPAGYYHMNGSLALWYARMRHASSDFDRSRRQQQVLRAIWRTARGQGMIAKLPDLWGQMNGIVQTSLTLPDLIGLAPIALNLKPGDITSYYMNKGYETQHWKTPLGEDVQLPDPKGFFDTINRFYTPPTQNRLGAEGITMDVINGSGHADWDKVAVDRLAWGGFEAAAKGAGDTAAKTVVYDYTGNAKPATLNALLKALNVRADVVQSQPDPNRTVDYKVVLGADYNSCSAPGYTK